MLASVMQDHMTAEDTEHAVLKAVRTTRAAPKAKAGAPVTRVGYTTSAARVQLTFRRKNVTAKEVVAALHEAEAQARQEMGGAPSDAA